MKNFYLAVGFFALFSTTALAQQDQIMSISEVIDSIDATAVITDASWGDIFGSWVLTHLYDAKNKGFFRLPDTNSGEDSRGRAVFSRDNAEYITLASGLVFLQAKGAKSSALKCNFYQGEKEKVLLCASKNGQWVPSVLQKVR